VATAPRTAKTPSARQRAGQPAAPGTPGKQPAAATITSLGDGAASGEQPDFQAQIAELQQMAERLARQQQAAAGQRALPAAPPRPDGPGPLNWRGIEPLRLPAVSDDDEPEPVGRHALFYIGDTEYTIPDEVPQSDALEFLHLMAAPDLGPLVGQDFLLTMMLGAREYRELRAYKPLTSAQLAWIIETCTKICLGVLETPKE
jgi:hypothetical protein